MAMGPGEVWHKLGIRQLRVTLRSWEETGKIPSCMIHPLKSALRTGLEG